MNTLINHSLMGLCPEKFWVKDIDGNVLKTYRVGKFLITENIKTEHYNDGTPIPVLEDAENWKNDTSGAMCYYKNDLNNKKQYGALYNFYAVQTGKLAPASFHVPTDDDWKEIEINIGMSNEEADDVYWRGKGIGKKMIQVLEMGMGGYRNYSGGTFHFLGTGGSWWSSTPNVGSSAWRRNLYCTEARVYRNTLSKANGFSVRCVRELTQDEIDLFDNLSISGGVKRDEKGRFVKQNKEIDMNEKTQDTAEPEKLSIKERICLKFILLAIKILRPICYESEEIEEIKKML